MNRVFIHFGQGWHRLRPESLPQRHPLLVSLFMALALLCLQLLFFRPYFLVNDDIFKTLMVRGIGVNPEPTPYFLCSSVTLGFFFMKWYAWFPNFPWYGWFLYAVQFLSLGSLLWVYSLSSRGWFKVLLFVVSCLGVQTVFFMFLQFTSAALMAAGSGILLFYFSMEPGREQGRIWVWLVSGTLLWESWLIRPDSFYVMVLVALPPFLLGGLEKAREITGASWKFVSLVCLLIALAGIFDFCWYQKNEPWKEFETFRKEAVEFQQYQTAGYSPRTKPLFDSVGWSENDDWLFRNWFWMDLWKFEVLKIEKLSADFPKMGAGGKGAAFNSLTELLGSHWDLRILLYFLVFIVFCGGKASRYLLAQLSWIILVFLFLIYFMKTVDRVTLPLLAYLMNLAIFFAEPPVFPKGKNAPLPRRLFATARVLLLSSAFVFAFPNLRDYYHFNLQRRIAESQIRSCLVQMSPKENQLYITWDFPFEVFGAFDNYDCFKPFHMVTTSFIQRAPVQMDMLKKRGIGNVFKAAVDNPDILMICNKEEGFHYHTYMAENFHENIYAEKVFDGGYYKVYSIRSKNS